MTDHRERNVSGRSGTVNIDELKAMISLEEVVRKRGVALQANASGERLEGSCPFHRYDETPSFNVYVASQRYHCFGCGANGDVIDFVQAFDSCSWQEAVHRLQANIIPLVTHKLLQQRQPRQTQPVPFPRQEELTPPAAGILLSPLSRYYQQRLLHNPALCAMLEQERGITRQGIMQCQLGYADGTIAAWMQQQGWRDEEHSHALQKIGVLSAAGYERLHHRLIIPEWTNEQCGWMIGRQFPSRITAQRSTTSRTRPKYLGLRGSKPLLGYGVARERLKAKALVRAIVVVEGAIDYVIATQWALQGALPIVCVALVGIYASRRQLGLLLDLQQRANQVPILVSLDGDDAGQQANLRLLQQLHHLQRPALVLPPIAGAKDIGDLGVHPKGKHLLVHAVEQALIVPTRSSGAEH